MRLILVRHGETEHNRTQLTLGRADVPLNARGQAQARAVASSFTRPPGALYTSPLQRAAVTAGAIATACGVEATVDDALVEMDVGEMEHLTGAELRAQYQEFLGTWLSAEATDARMPGGETLREVQARAWASVERMRATHGGETVVVVTHNFVILTLVCRALDLPLDRFRKLRHGVAARTTIDITDQGCTLVRLNDQSHLLAAGLAADDPPGREARA